jgi:CHAT domain-containing protein
LGELDQARDDLLACLEQAKQLDAPDLQIEALTTLGNLYADLGAYDRGLEMAMQADTLAGRIGSDQLLAGAYVLAANMEQSLGHPAAALRYRERSREKNEKQGAEIAVLYDDVAIASFRAMLGQKEEARELFYRTLPHVRELNARDLEEAVHFGIGHTYEKENPDSAAYHYEKALSLIEESRAQIGGAEMRTGFFSGARRFYYEEVARYYASLEAGKKSGKWSSSAFQTIERAKARGLLDLLERAVSVESSAGEDAIVDSLYQVAGDSPQDKDTKRRLEKRYLELKDERLAATVGPLDPRGGVVTLLEVQRALPRGTALLEYALGDTCSLLWVVDREGFDVFMLPNRSGLRVDVERFRDAIQKPGAGDAVLRETAASLYDQLVRPAERRLARVAQLVIVPDGFLFEVPFEALLTEKPSSEAGWRDLPYLARSFETVYSPSASIFSKMSKTRKKAKYGVELLAFGDPDFSHFTRGPAVGIGGLPYSRSEVERIGSFLGDAKKRIFLGADASELHLKASVRSGRPPRILHFATHGLVDRAEPEASSVVLAPDTSAGEDGYLHALEILTLPLEAGLVVLSACESAQGQVGRGEGVVGLSRAFIASGSQGVVASLWAVSDESTSELMATFYAEMLGRKRPACEALKTARLSLIENPERAHPFYWSPFVVIGTGRAPW